jgi:hypothetical protein
MFSRRWWPILRANSTIWRVPYRNKGFHPDKTKLDDNTKLLIRMKATKYNMTLVNNVNLMIIFKPLNQSIANTTHRVNGFYLVSYPPNSRSEKPNVSQMHLAIVGNFSQMYETTNLGNPRSRPWEFRLIRQSKQTSAPPITNVNSWRERAGRDLSEELFVDLMVFRRKSRVRDSSKMLVTRYQLDPYCKGKPLRC